MNDPVSARLPDFPWDLLAPFAERARAHPDGIVDLSMGTPVDPTPAAVQDALGAAADAPGYPTTAGSPALRAAALGWISRRTDAGGLSPDAVLPTIGSKELVASLPSLLGLGAGDTVAIPHLAYPTYEVGARLAGARRVTYDTPEDLGRLDAERVRLVWVNSPANPTGRVLDPAQLAAALSWARSRGAVLASDECYLDLGWDVEPTSVLALCDGRFEGVLAVHSLSKRSNLAGYRAGLVSGDPTLVAELLAVRKHSGMMMPAPVQAAMAAALADETHVADQRERYRRRRVALREALDAAAFRIEHSGAGLYLWATRDEDCWSTVDWLAGLGILAAPGIFYGAAGASHVRLALTASDERVAATAKRLATAS